MIITDFLNSFFRRIIVTQAVVVVILLFAGWLLTLAQGGQYHRQTFFEYRIRHLDKVPAWFASVMLLLMVNGWYLYRWAMIQGQIGTPNNGPWGNYDVHVPLPSLKLFAVNLIAIPALLTGFIIVRTMGW